MTVLTRPPVHGVDSGDPFVSGASDEIEPQQLKQTDRNLTRTTGFADGLFLASIVVGSMLSYVGGLGFYADDWDGLGFLVNATDQSVPGLYQAYASPPEHALFLMRPLQIFLFTASFWAFGLNPIGYHLFNGALMLANVLFGSYVLRALGAGRLASLSIPLLFATLPHASADRFWIATSQIHFCLLMFLVSLYGDFRAIQAPGWARFGWKSLALVAILLGGLAYEIALPLILFNTMVVFWIASRTRPSLFRAALTTLGHLAPGVLLVVAIMLFKAVTTTRIHHEQGLVVYLLALARHAVDPGVGPLESGINLFQAVWVAFVTFGVALPLTAGQLALTFPNPGALLVTATIGVACAAYLWRVTSSADVFGQIKTTGLWQRLLGLGLVVFVLGQSIFLLTWDINYAPAGVANRVMLASLAGVAVTLIGAVGWVATWFRADRRRRSVFVAGVTTIVVSGTLTLQTLAGFWTQAAANQQAVLAAFQREFPSISEGAVFLLDGSCPYVGPAVVFEAPWDLSKALRVHYRVSHFRADVVTPRLKVSETGITTVIYQSIRNDYAYGNDLILFNVRSNRIVRLTDATTARRYFAESNPDFSSGCRPSREGFGEHVIG